MQIVLVVSFIQILLYFFITTGKCRKPQARVYGGYEAYIGQFPWDAKVICTETHKRNLCGGSLIHPKHVLTAAHCVVKSFSCMVKLGHYNDAADTEEGRIIFENVKNWEEHPLYEDDNFQDVRYDIAIIQLPVAVALSNQTGVIKLPASDETYVHRIVTVMGWGNRTNETGIVSNQVMKFAFMKVIEPDDCKHWVMPNDVIMKDRFICAKHITHMICAGDCGGSLIYDGEGINTLIGVTVLGDVKCQDPNVPQGFIRLSKHLEWIHKTIGTPRNKQEKAVNVVDDKNEEKSTHGGCSCNVMGILLLISSLCYVI